MSTRRATPIIWTTWISKLLAGVAMCEWAAWFQAHHSTFARVADDGDSLRHYKLQHTPLLRKACEELESDGYAVTVEEQNRFELPGSSGAILAGKPDIIAVRGRSGLIVDAKAAKNHRDDHDAQVMIYMWAVPLAFRQFRGVSFSGRVIYQDGRSLIDPSEVGKPFQDNLLALLRRVAGPEPCRKVPCWRECQFCRIAQSECPERVTAVQRQEVGELVDF